MICPITRILADSFFILHKTDAHNGRSRLLYRTNHTKCSFVYNISNRWLKLALQWRRNGHYGVSNYRRLDCLLKRLFRCTETKTSKLHVTGLCEGNPPVTSGLPSQRARNVENVSISWRHHAKDMKIMQSKSDVFSSLPLKAACISVLYWTVTYRDSNIYSVRYLTKSQNNIIELLKYPWIQRRNSMLEFISFLYTFQWFCPKFNPRSIYCCFL